MVCVCYNIVNTIFGNGIAVGTRNVAGMGVVCVLYS